MKNIFLLLLFATLILQSCSKSDDVTNGGTFSITASTGTTKTLTMQNGTLRFNFFDYSITLYPNSTRLVLDISGIVDYTSSITGNTCGVTFIYDPPIEIKKVYTSIVGSNNSVYIDFTDWVDSDNSNKMKTTIVFSDYNYPGHISGVVQTYDKNGKPLARGVFDFISTKAVQ